MFYDIRRQDFSFRDILRAIGHHRGEDVGCSVGVGGDEVELIADERRDRPVTADRGVADAAERVVGGVGA